MNVDPTAQHLANQAKLSTAFRSRLRLTAGVCKRLLFGVLLSATLALAPFAPAQAEGESRSLSTDSAVPDAVTTLPAQPAQPSQPAPPAASRIGQVVFVVGEAQLQRDAHAQPIVKGLTLQEGDSIKTGPTGHVHLRMQDQGFIAVRPGSDFQIRHYRWQPQTPAANQVLLHLEKGVARTVSGQAGEANRARYRFTTPVAAIGLRGTDYVVQADTERTLVNVLQGAIVINPLGPGCSADLASPCHTPYMQELSAKTPQAYLEVYMQGTTPAVVRHEQGAADPAAPLTPAHPAEPRPAVGPGLKPGKPQEPKLEPTVKLEKDAQQAVQNGAAQDAGAEALAATIVWGRWSHVAISSPTLLSQLKPNREVSFANELFALLRPSGKPQLPRGTLGMHYSAGEAWLKTASGPLQALAVSDGRLHLDFDRREFKTSLQVATPEVTQGLYAQGSLNPQGEFRSHASVSNMNVAGVIGSQAKEVGYLFDSAQLGGTIYGATHWRN